MFHRVTGSGAARGSTRKAPEERFGNIDPILGSVDSRILPEVSRCPAPNARIRAQTASRLRFAFLTTPLVHRLAAQAALGQSHPNYGRRKGLRLCFHFGW